MTMMKNTSSSPAILYHNEQDTIFLIDIPTSIALAQELSPQQLELHHQQYPQPGQPSPQQPQQQQQHPRRQPQRTLLSNHPLTKPYTTPEPKTPTARNRVLQRIPPAERIYHGEIIAPVVHRALRELRDALGEGESESEPAKWCLDRWVPTASTSGQAESDQHEQEQVLLHPRKRRRAAAAAAAHDDRQCGSPVWRVESGVGTEDPPVILSPGPGVNAFVSGGDVTGVVVRNTSAVGAAVRVGCEGSTAAAAAATPPPTTTTSSSRNNSGSGGGGNEKHHTHTYTVPASSTFLLTHLPLSNPPPSLDNPPIPNLPPTHKFNLILLDPPWTNRSVHRSGHYHTQAHSDGNNLTRYIQSVLQVHLQPSPPTNPSPNEGQTQTQSQTKDTPSIAAIWTTNSSKARTTAHAALASAGLVVIEEWIWLKVTTAGEPVSPVDALWRKPYEVLVIGCRPGSQKNDGFSQEGGSVGLASGGEDAIMRRVIAAVPDVHSRKPNLRELFERVFFADCQYSAMEVFARHLTAGWWACGDEVVKFNEDVWWCAAGMNDL